MARRFSTLSPVSSIPRFARLRRSRHGRTPCRPPQARGGAGAWRPGFRPERMRVLCQAAASLNLMQRRRDGRYALGRLGAGLPGIPGPVSDDHAPRRALSRSRETRLISSPMAPAPNWRNSGPTSFGATGDVSPETAETYSELMAQSQTLVAEEALRVVDLRGVETLLDIGGGTGAFLTAAGLPIRPPPSSLRSACRGRGRRRAVPAQRPD
jgi:hypothetical protein